MILVLFLLRKRLRLLLIVTLWPLPWEIVLVIICLIVVAHPFTQENTKTRTKSAHPFNLILLLPQSTQNRFSDNKSDLKPLTTKDIPPEPFPADHYDVYS